MKRSVTFTKEELNVLAHITRNFTDYVWGDDRPDHGLNNLYGYRNVSKEVKQNVSSAMGKLNRAWRKTWNEK